jgi:hypothetical protein
MRAVDQLPDRHEVLYLAHAVGSEEASDENVGVGEIELLRRPALIGRSQPIRAAAPSVENRGKDARRVKARAAIPVDRPVGPDKRNAVQVTDQPVIGDWEITAEPIPPDLNLL